MPTLAKFCLRPLTSEREEQSVVGIDARKRHPMSLPWMLLGAWLSWSAPVLALDFSGSDEPGSPRSITPRSELELGADERQTIDLFERSRASVVFITTQQQVMNVMTRDVFSVPQGTGSGFVWDHDGHVVTNYHVVREASEALVRLADGRDYKASLVGVSTTHDIAVLKIRVEGAAPPPVPLGTSHDLQVGQKVFAIGNPFGLDWTLTTGIVSALDRSLPEDNGISSEHLIQTDAAINPGNSGGPLLDSAGRLIGINTAIFSPSGASAGIGFSVPVDTVNRVVPQIIRTGRYTRPVLGIQVDDAINRQLSLRLKLKGVAILGVARGSPADRAGLEAARMSRNGQIALGDVVVAIDGKAVDSVGKLFARLDDHEVGSTVKLSVQREGEVLVVPVTLAAGK